MACVPCKYVGVYIGGLSGLCLWWMCGHGNVWIWCEYSYGVATVDEFVDHPSKDK